MHLKGDLIAAYARYSSDKQNESSVEDQLRRLRTFAATSGRELSPHLTFTDHAVSGASMARPAFEALMAKVRRREVDVVLVEDTSRLSRDNADALNLYKTFNFFGVQLVAVSDGIDSMTKGAKLAYSVKALMSDLYLEDLRDKTLRGMEGRAHTGLSTGGLPIGYRSVPIPGPDPRAPAGFRIEIDERGAGIVRRIFQLLIEGHAQNAIAKRLNEEGVPSPRDRMRHEKKTGWAGTTIRVILHNEKYHGVWRFNERRWIKMPGTNRRVPQKKDASEVITYQRPELAIVDDATWNAVQQRLLKTRELFTMTPDGRRKGRALASMGIVHPLSGLLECECGAPMVINGNGKSRYYGCVAGRRGRCPNERLIRESVIRQCLLRGIVELLTDRKRIDPVRKQLENEQRCAAALRAQAARVRATVVHLQRQIAEVGGAGASDPARRAELEDQMSCSRREAEILALEVTRPAVIRSDAHIVRDVEDLGTRMDSAPTAAKDVLRLWLGGSRIRVGRNDKGECLASTTLHAEFILLAAQEVGRWDSTFPITRLDLRLGFECLLVSEEERLARQA